MQNKNMLSTQPQFTFWNPNNANVQPPLSPIQRQQQQQLLNENFVKKTTNGTEGQTPSPQEQPQKNEFQQPPSSNTPQQLSNDFSSSNNKDTPNSTPRSPGGGSNSSFHEDDTMMSSPNSSMQASSPKQHHINNANLNNSSSLLNSSNHASNNNNNNSADVFQKLLDMGTESDRKTFVERLQTVWDEYSIQCKSLPNLSKHTLDLYRLYSFVRDRGGFNEVTRLKLWKDVTSLLNITISANSAFIVKKKFVQFGIFHYECKYDRSGVDPVPLIIEMEKSSKKVSTSIKSGMKLFHF
jgi:hypothetical protein